MPHIRDFEPILLNPQPYVEKALALYERAVHEKRGHVVFITAELGGGKTELLSALAKALYLAKPTPNFTAGFFRGGEYCQFTMNWQKNICLNKTVMAAGGIASLLSLCPIQYGFAASFIGQLLQTSVYAREFAEQFLKKPPPRKVGPDWLKNLLRRAAQKKPLICLLDDWDEAQRFYWDSMLFSLAREVAQDLPLLLFISVKEPINSDYQEKDESDLTHVIKSLTEKGLAELWPLKKLSHGEISLVIGKVAPDIVSRLHDVTGGNPRWIRELWLEWRLNEIVVSNEADHWIWGKQHTTAVNLYKDILEDRLKRLLKAKTAVEVEAAREVLACAALEGVRFTADAVALVLNWDRDKLIDFLDEILVQSEDNPNGLILEDGSINITKSNVEAHTLWLYRFVSDLHWMAMERYGFANEHRTEKDESERLERSKAVINALRVLYAPHERFVAAPLARLMIEIGHNEEGQHYQRIADYIAEREVMRSQALYLLTIKKDDWEKWQRTRIATFLIEAGKVMFNACAHNETQAVFEEAANLAGQVNDLYDEAHANYYCSFILHQKGENKLARERANDSLNAFRFIRNKSGIAASLAMLAEIDFKEGDYNNAREQGKQALQIHQELGSRRNIAASLNLLTQIEKAEGNYAEARKRVTQALQIGQKLGDLNNTVVSLGLLAEINHAEGNHAEAREQAEQALKIYQELGWRQGAGVLLNLLGRIDLTEGYYTDARVEAEQAFQIHQELGDESESVNSLCLLALIDYEEGNYAEALDQAVHVLELEYRLGRQPGIAITLALIARIAYRRELLNEAFNLMALSYLILSHIGHAYVEKSRSELATMASTQKYTKEQQDKFVHQVSMYYMEDGGKGLIENALERLRNVFVK
jgi:tetratricopeptide (TPR) repeat protein